jgi:cytochrome c biogenesis protein
LAAHSAIVLVCIGGLLDGDLVVRAQMWFNNKTPFTGGGMIADVAPEHRLSDRNPTFRGNLLVTEGTRANTAILAQPTGVMLQELPFDLELKKFVVEYYSTGMPTLFASDIVIHDRYSGETKEARVEVNHPVSHRGIEIYQSSFDDGGSLLKFKALGMGVSTQPFEVEGRVGTSVPLSNGDKKLNLEFTGLRVINVENFGANGAGSGTDVRKVDLRQAIESRLGAGHKTSSERVLRNVGPSVSYKLRDEAGQAREFNNYMLPVDMDGQRVFLLGARDTPGEPFRYLRVPADAQDSLDSFVRMRAALNDADMRRKAVQRYTAQAVEGQSADMGRALTVSAQRAIDLFAGVDPFLNDLPKTQDATGNPVALGGLQAVSAFMEANVPQAEREKAGDVLLRILNGTLFELLQLSQEGAGQPPVPRDDKTAAFMTQAVLGLSDAFFYPAPMTFMLQDFTQVQASVFQVARAPGKTIVYLGCLFLIIGVFAMLYVRERRLWVWLAPSGQGNATQALMALSTNRKMLDTDREFESLKTKLLEVHA